ncbi:sulfatase-like hydrolase/transferase [Botrimarina sp.]|uniref:sulfatase-like hydrolase/transferase n=1 Tax=Botrimarina sp. TaxID=2795802 RepID=UPI0032EFD260
MTRLFSLLALALSAAAAGGERPNVLFLFADDLAFDAVLPGEHDGVDTPHLDRLAERGVVFTRAYNPGSWTGAVCVPSRTMLNTGRFLWDAHEIHEGDRSGFQEKNLWSNRLRRAGYHTFFAGKWHLPFDPHEAFDTVGTVRPGMPPTVESAYNRPPAEGPDPWRSDDRSLGGFWQGGRHWSEVLADEAVEYLGGAARRERPFFLQVAFNAPHDPRQAPTECLERYPLDRVATPEPFAAEYPYNEAIGCGRTHRDERLGPFPRTEHAVRVHRREYHALITHTDEQVGRVLEALVHSGEADDTWVVFTADHGLAVGRHGLMGKQNLYDHSVRVPLIVVGPGVPAGERRDQPVYLQSVNPTTLELAGAPALPGDAFPSLLPLVGDPDRRSEHEAIYGAYRELQRSVTRDGWKLIAYPAVPTVRLYHVAEDPRETRDLADEPEQSDRVRSLFAVLLRLQARYDDPAPLAEAFPDLAPAGGAPSVRR